MGIYLFYFWTVNSKCAQLRGSIALDDLSGWSLLHPAQLFECSTDHISLQLKNIFKVGELKKEAVTEESLATGADGKNYKTKFYRRWIRLPPL